MKELIKELTDYANIHCGADENKLVELLRDEAVRLIERDWPKEKFIDSVERVTRID